MYLTEVLLVLGVLIKRECQKVWSHQQRLSHQGLMMIQRTCLCGNQKPLHQLSREMHSPTSYRLQMSCQVLQEMHGMDPVLAPPSISLPPGFTLPGSSASPVILPRPPPQMPPLCDLSSGPSIVPPQASVPPTVAAPSPRPFLMWEVKPLVEPSSLMKAVSGESVRIQDESPAISPPGFGPPGFTTLGSRAQTVISSPSKKAVLASMKRIDSELEASTRETIALQVSNDMNSMQGAAKRRRLIGPS
ncbi:unnamed protein product [Closterium sp. NIES-54]